MPFEDHPGYLGFTSQGVIAIHANWPAYPREHGWDVALHGLGNFPAGTQFRFLDNIDGCALFVVEDSANKRKEMDESRYHVAMWHEDLQDLVLRGFVLGVEVDTDTLPQEIWRRMSLGEKGYQRYKNGAFLGFVVDGKFTASEWPAVPPDRELLDEDEDESHLAATARLGIYENLVLTLSDAGVTELDRVARQQLFVPPRMQNRLLPLLTHSMFDTAIRELGVAIERSMRDTTRTEHYGKGLVGVYVKALKDTHLFVPAALKGLPLELRTAIQFVRNEFAHDLVDVPPERGYALIGRLCALLSELDEVADVLAGEPTDSAAAATTDPDGAVEGETARAGGGEATLPDRTGRGSD